MKNLIIRDGNACDEVNILASLFIDKEQEYRISTQDYNDHAPHLGRRPFFHTGGQRGFVVRDMTMLEVVDRVNSKIPGVRLTTRNQNVISGSNATEHVYVHLNDEPFYRAVIYFGYTEVSICSHHLNANNLVRRIRSSPVPRLHGSHSYNSVDRGMTLKNLPNDVLGVVKKICAATPVTVSDFEGVVLNTQKNRVAALTEGNAAVTSAIKKLIGRGYSYGSADILDDELRVAAFLALESVVKGTTPTVDRRLAERFGKYIPLIDAAREDAAATVGKVPVQIIKIKGHDCFVAKTGSRVTRWQQLPDAVVGPVATMMSLGADGGGSVAGVGSMVVPVATSPVELDVVVMVGAEENL